jgi:hypothetical protein
VLIRDSLRRLLQLQIGALITDFVTGRAEGGGEVSRAGIEKAAGQRWRARFGTTLEGGEGV